MKKKLTALLGNAQAKGNARFKTLYQEYQSATAALAKAKEEKTAAKKAYQQLLQESKPDGDQVFERLSGFRKAKFWRQYQREVLHLSEYRLRRWIEEFEKNNAAKPSKKEAAATKGKKSAPAGKASRTSAKSLDKKSGEKAKTSKAEAAKPAKKTVKNKPTS